MEHKSFVTHYGKLFLAVLSVFTVLFGIYLFASNNALRKSQDKIIESYIKHVQSVDSMYLARVGSMTDLLSTSQTIKCSGRKPAYPRAKAYNPLLLKRSFS